MEWRLDGRMHGSMDKWRADGTHQQALSPPSYLSACPHHLDSCVSPGVLSPPAKVSLPSIQCFSFALLVDSDSEPKCLWKYNQQSLQLRSPAWGGWRSDQMPAGQPASSLHAARGPASRARRSSSPARLLCVPPPPWWGVLSRFSLQHGCCPGCS